MFPLGLYNGGPISFPVLNKNGTFLNFYDVWVGGRKYPVDMAGFAVNVQHFVEVNFNIVIPGSKVFREGVSRSNFTRSKVYFYTRSKVLITLYQII